MTKKNISMDSQVLSTLMSCGRLTDFRFNMNLQSIEGKPISFEMGSIVHKGLEIYYKHLAGNYPKRMAEEQAKVAAKEYSKDPKEVSNATPKDIDWAIETLEQCIIYYRDDPIIPKHVEHVLGAVIYEDDEIRILWKAKFDLLADLGDGTKMDTPVDHKTMKQRRDTVSLNNQFIGQCILAGTRSMIVNKVGFQTSLKPEEKFLRARVTYTADRLFEWQSQILPYWAKTLLNYKEGDYYPPNFTHCENKYGMCAFKGACEVDRNLREDVLKMDFVVGKPWDIQND